ncbi:hypothetical protein Vretifemale_19325 [Volvox reticuliferus]|uniref:Exocyst complex subunit EXOC6/Sec15 C-terminal domain-containing protein n=1 Tax=Volvox reticuliferus TaxID=1737510 RepID=A0A8J4FYF2_9CHLO|nr:hypothetical protein Vretifemale_19325 [Volvox reticuliferus]
MLSVAVIPTSSPPRPHPLATAQDTFDAAASILPRSSFLFLSRAVVRATGNALMALLKEGVKTYNMFAVERLATDVALLDRFIVGCPVPHLAQEFAEPRQLCALLLSPRVGWYGEIMGWRHYGLGWHGNHV